MAGVGAAAAVIMVAVATMAASTKKSRSPSAHRRAASNMINAAAHLAEIYTLVSRSGFNKE